jgi:hypothetical protein
MLLLEECVRESATRGIARVSLYKSSIELSFLGRLRREIGIFAAHRRSDSPLMRHRSLRVSYKFRTVTSSPRLSLSFPKKRASHFSQSLDDWLCLVFFSSFFFCWFENKFYIFHLARKRPRSTTHNHQSSSVLLLPFHMITHCFVLLVCAPESSLCIQ